MKCVGLLGGIIMLLNDNIDVYKILLKYLIFVTTALFIDKLKTYIAKYFYCYLS